MEDEARAPERLRSLGESISSRKKYLALSNAGNRVRTEKMSPRLPCRSLEPVKGGRGWMGQDRQGDVLRG